MKLLSLALLVSPVLGAVMNRRQISPSDIPPQCSDACAAALALQSSCTGISCLCTADSDTAIQGCANCVIPLNPGLESTLQPYVNDFNLLCPGLPPLTFPPIPQSTAAATPPASSDSGTPDTTDDSSSDAPTTTDDGDSSSDAATPTADGDSSSDPAATSPDTGLPAATDTTNSTGAYNVPLTTAGTGSTTVNATQTARAATTSHTTSGTTTIPTTTQTSSGLLTAKFSRFPVGLLILLATCTLA